MLVSGIADIAAAAETAGADHSSSPTHLLQGSSSSSSVQMEKFPMAGGNTAVVAVEAARISQPSQRIDVKQAEAGPRPASHSC